MIVALIRFNETNEMEEYLKEIKDIVLEKNISANTLYGNFSEAELELAVQGFNATIDNFDDQARLTSS